MQAGRDVREGKLLHARWLLIATPTLVDPSRAPEGMHTVKLLSMVPWNDGDWDTLKHEVADENLAALRRAAPNMTRRRRPRRADQEPGRHRAPERAHVARHDPRRRPRRARTTARGGPRPAGRSTGCRSPASTRPAPRRTRAAPSRAAPGRNAAIVLLEDLGQDPRDGDDGARRPGRAHVSATVVDAHAHVIVPGLGAEVAWRGRRPGRRARRARDPRRAARVLRPAADPRRAGSGRRRRRRAVRRGSNLCGVEVERQNEALAALAGDRVIRVLGTVDPERPEQLVELMARRAAARRRDPGACRAAPTSATRACATSGRRRRRAARSSSSIQLARLRARARSRSTTCGTRSGTRSRRR